MNRHGPPLVVTSPLFVDDVCLFDVLSFLFVLLSRKRVVSKIPDADFVANAKDQSPSSRLESVVVDTGFALIENRSKYKPSKCLQISC